MPVLSRQLYEELCDSSKAYLGSQNIIMDENAPQTELGEHYDQIMTQLIKNERCRVGCCEKNYQKEKYKANSIFLFLIAALALFGAGFALAPLFIASPIVVPPLIILCFEVAIAAIAKFCLNIKTNHLEATAKHAASTLKQLKESVGRSPDDQISHIFGTVVQGIKNQTETDSARDSYSSSQLLAGAGTFPAVPATTTTTASIESANVPHDMDNASSRLIR